MEISLKQVLALIGKLDDSTGKGTPRERFRAFLKENVTEVGLVRDYIQECISEVGEQYNRALQDLVNHLGGMLAFEVTFGRYHGVQGQIGFDGHWGSPTGLHIVVEVKTSEVYAVKTSALIGYVDQLISAKEIPDWDNALGLYTVGRLDQEASHLVKTITGEKNTSRLRVISVESLLRLAELMSEYDVNHDDMLAVLRPSGPLVDPVIDLMNRLAVQPEPPEEVTEAEEATEEVAPLPDGPAYWLTPVRSDEEATAEETVQTLVGEGGIYAFGQRTPGRKWLKPGDWMCFYATGKGVVAHAKVLSAAKKKHHPAVRHPDRYPWTFRLGNAKLYLDSPVVLTPALRAELEGFKGRSTAKYWSWFVQATGKVSAHDFAKLTRGSSKPSTE